MMRRLAIQATSQTPSIHSLHPQDRVLLRPLQTLGKPKPADAAVSFLRRTEYISSVSAKNKHEIGALRSLNPTPLKRKTKRPSPEPDIDSPAYVKRKIDQSFSLAATHLKDKTRVRHPTKRHLKLVDSFPMIPDLEAFPDYGGYFTIKFTNNPVPASGTYDKRLLNAIIKPETVPEETEAAYKLAKQAHDRDPDNNPKPMNPQTYNYYLSDSLETSDKFNQRFDALNPDCNADDLYTSQNSDGNGCFQFRFVRTYETKDDVELDNTTKYDEELLIAFNNDAVVDQKAVYYSPVMHRLVVKPQRSKTIHRNAGLAEDVEEIPDRLAVTVNDFDDKTKSVMDKWKTDPYKDPFAETEAEDGADRSENHGDAVNGHGEEEEVAQHDSDEEQDAEGDEEE